MEAGVRLVILLVKKNTLYQKTSFHALYHLHPALNVNIRIQLSYAIYS